jgi:hypothetical protein
LSQKAACDDFLFAIKPFWKECPELTEHWCLKYLSVRNYNIKKAVPRYGGVWVSSQLRSKSPSLTTCFHLVFNGQ